jgi:isopenicillin N synthase-like dioxygenase
MTSTTGIDAIKRGDIPVLDISASTSRDADARAALATELGAACESVGFLVITGHGIEPTTIDSLLGSAREFFEADDGEKMNACRPARMCSAASSPSRARR